MFCNHQYWVYGSQPVSRWGFKMFWYFCAGCGMPLPNPTIKERYEDHEERSPANPHGEMRAQDHKG